MEDNQSSKSFELMNLPPELRLMTYEEAHHSEHPPWRLLQISTGTSHSDIKVSLTNHAPNINLLLISKVHEKEVHSILQKDQILNVDLPLTEDFLRVSCDTVDHKGRPIVKHFPKLQSYLCSKIEALPLYAPSPLKDVSIELTIPRYWSQEVGGITSLWQKDQTMREVFWAVADKLNELNGRVVHESKRSLTFENFAVRLVIFEDDECKPFDMKCIKQFILKSKLGAPKVAS